jgi:hypothetical protein
VQPHTAVPVLTASLPVASEEHGWFLIVLGVVVIALSVQRLWFAHRPGGGYHASVAAPRRWQTVITRAKPIQFRVLTAMWVLAALVGAWSFIRGGIDVFLWITR